VSPVLNYVLCRPGAAENGRADRCSILNAAHNQCPIFPTLGPGYLVRDISMSLFVSCQRLRRLSGPLNFNSGKRNVAIPGLANQAPVFHLGFFRGNACLRSNCEFAELSVGASNVAPDIPMLQFK
jgi:hypothetical protein